MKLSVITACHNSAASLPDALQSIYNQTYKNIEHILIDGNSQDNTKAVISRYADKIAYFVSEPDTGIYDALNKGIRQASGDYIAFLHADDMYASPEILEKAMQQLTQSGSDSLYADLQYISHKNPKKVIRRWKAGTYKASRLPFGWMPPHPTFIVKKEIYEKYGFFDLNFQIAGDYDMIIRLLGTKNIRVTYLPEVMILMRTGGASNGSFSNILLKMKEDYRALGKNRIGGAYTVFCKNIRKIPQLFF